MEIVAIKESGGRHSIPVQEKYERSRHRHEAHKRVAMSGNLEAMMRTIFTSVRRFDSYPPDPPHYDLGEWSWISGRDYETRLEFN